MARRSMEFVADKALEADAFVVNGMPNFRRKDGLPERMVSLDREIETLVGKPVISSDTALYWRLFRTLQVEPQGQLGSLLSSLQRPVPG